MPENIEAILKAAAQAYGSGRLSREEAIEKVCRAITEDPGRKKEAQRALIRDILSGQWDQVSGIACDVMTTAEMLERIGKRAPPKEDE